MNARLRRFLLIILPPVVVFALFVTAWHVIVKARDVPEFIVPAPTSVLQQLFAMDQEDQSTGIFSENGVQLLTATWLTAKAAAAGFALSIIVGTLIAFFFSQSVIIQRAFFPYAIFLQTVPVIAIAPLMVRYVGQDVKSIIATSFLVSVFPMIASGTTGLTQVDRGLMELFDVNNATRLQKLFKLRLPAAVPYLVAGARTASGLAVIGAITGEFFAGFGGTSFGLGYLIYMTNSQLKTAYLFASVLAATLLGIAFFVVITWAGRAILSRYQET